MKCVQCAKEFTPKTAKARYCSNKCRVAGHRQTEGDTHRGQITDKLVKDMTAEDLYDEINAYQHDDLVRSAEYAELMFRLKTYSYERLKEEGYSIPNWREKQEKKPKI